MKKPSPHPHAPELGLDVGIGLEGDFDGGSVALAGDALGFGPGAQVAGGFHGHGGALGRSDFETQRSIGFRGLESQVRAVVHRAAAGLDYRGYRVHRADVEAAAGDFHLLELQWPFGLRTEPSARHEGQHRSHARGVGPGRGTNRCQAHLSRALIPER